MNRFLLNTLIITLLFVLITAAGYSGTTSRPSVPKQSCHQCHNEFTPLLPAKHPTVAGKDISSCTSCHVPDSQNKAKPDPYSSKLHLSHMQQNAKLDCMTCHIWQPGKSFGLKGTKIPFGALSKEGMEQIKRVFDSWAASKYLDAHHGKKNITCSGCHEAKLPEKGDSVENGRCLACHGDFEKLAKKTEPKDFPDRNPHKSHLGSIDCAVCHKAHGPSRSYCLDCHKKFDMKIPFGEASAGPKAAAGGKVK